MQTQRTVEDAVCNQVLPQVQSVLREVQTRDASGPRDQARPELRSECLDLEKRDHLPKSSSNMTLNGKENAAESHYTELKGNFVNDADLFK